MAQKHDVPDHVTTGQAAQILGVTSETVKRWVDNGQMPGYRDPNSGHRLIPVEKVHELRRQREAEAKRPRPPKGYRLGRRCAGGCGKPIVDNNRSGFCGTCSPRGGTRAWRLKNIQEWANRPEGGGGPDALGGPIAEWMIEEELTFEEAGKLVETHPETLALMTGFRGRGREQARGVHEDTLLRVARCLGQRRACGWDEEKWTNVLVAARRPDKHARTWVEDAVGSIETTDPLVSELKRKIIWIRENIHPLLSREQLASIAGISPARPDSQQYLRVVPDWLGVGPRRKGPVRPSLHRVGNVARVLAYPDTSPDQIEKQMERVLELLAQAEEQGLVRQAGNDFSWGRWRNPHAAGLFVLRELSEREKSVMWLSEVTRRESGVLYDYFLDGMAADETLRRVSDGLELTQEESGELRLRTTNPHRTRDEVKRGDAIRQTRKKKKAELRRKEALRSDNSGRQKATQGRIDEADMRILEAHARFREREHRAPLLAELVREAHSDDRTVKPCVEKHKLVLSKRGAKAEV
jgi:excisionase family DNA binding protein